MQEHAEDIDPSELETHRICVSCIGEQFLKAEVRRDGKRAKCFYCGMNGKTICIGDLADHFDVAFEEHFERTSAEPSALEYMMIKELDNYVWERKGERVSDVILSAAQIGEQPAEHVRELLDDRHYDHEEAKLGTESPYDEEAHYKEKDPEDHALQASWSYFQKSLRTKMRLFNREAEGILDSIFEGLAEHTTREGQPVIVAAGPGQPIAQLFRARTFQSSDELKGALIRPDLEIGPPPSPAAIELIPIPLTPPSAYSC